MTTDGLQNYLVFISTSRIEYVINGNYNIDLWGSTGVLQESIKNAHTSDTTFVPELNDKYRFNSVEFKRVCLK